MPGAKEVSAMTEPADVLIEEKRKGILGHALIDRPHMLFDGVSVGDPRAINLVRDLRSGLKTIGRDELKDGAYSSTGNHDGFDRLGNIMGVPMTPTGIAPYDAPSHLTKAAISARTLEVFRIMADILLPVAFRSAPASINKFSSIGLPTRAKDPATKTREALLWCRDAERRLEGVIAGRMKQVYTEHGIVWCFTLGGRNQPDKQGRKREVLSYLHGWVECDIAPPDGWPGKEEWWRRCRHRVINVAPMSSFPLRPLARAWKKHMDERFPFTCRHTTPFAIARKLARFKSVRFCDVANHDWNIPWSMVQILATTLAEKLGPIWAALLLMTMRQPQLLRPDSAEGTGARLEGDPFDLDTFRAKYVNPSGMPPTSEMARFAGMAYAIDGLVTIGAIQPTRAAIETVLLGNDEHWGFLNAGDNIALGGPSDQEVNAVFAAVKYASLDEADSFLGWVPFRDPVAGLVFEPAITSYIYNLIMPGRSADDPQRGDPIVGAPQRRLYYGQSRAFPAVDPVLRQCLADNLGLDYGAGAQALPVSTPQDYVRQLLMENFDAVHYKIEKEDVPADIAEQYFITIPAEEIAKLVAGVNAAGRRHEARWWALLDKLKQE
jgi:hypothetical protein